MGGRTGAQTRGARWEEGCVFGPVSDPRAALACSPGSAAWELKPPECKETLKKEEEACGPCDVGGGGPLPPTALLPPWVLWTHGFAFLSCCPLREEAVGCPLESPSKLAGDPGWCLRGHSTVTWLNGLPSNRMGSGKS